MLSSLTIINPLDIYRTWEVYEAPLDEVPEARLRGHNAGAGIVTKVDHVVRLGEGILIIRQLWQLFLQLPQRVNLYKITFIKHLKLK